MKTKTSKTTKTNLKNFCVVIHFDGAVFIDVKAKDKDDAANKADAVFGNLDAVKIANAIKDSWTDTVTEL